MLVANWEDNGEGKPKEHCETSGFPIYSRAKLNLHMMTGPWTHKRTQVLLKNACIQKHLHTKLPEVSTFLASKQACELLSNAAQAAGITSAHNMDTHTLTGQ